MTGTTETATGTGGAVAATGVRLRLARQARGFSQQQLAGMAGVTRQALSAVESGHSDPSLRVALALGRALGMTVEELFGPGDPAEAVTAVPVAPPGGPGSRTVLAPVGDTLVAFPLAADCSFRAGFIPAGGLVTGLSGGSAPPRGSASAAPLRVRPIGPPRPTLAVAGCDPALPLLEAPLGLLDPPVAFAWWPCGSAEALRLAADGLVHAAGVHASDPVAARDGAEVVGFTSWREGLAIRPELAGTVSGLADIARLALRLVNREPGSQARSALDRELLRLGIDAGELRGYDTEARGHLQVASAVAAGLADAGVASEPAALAYGLGFIPLADERFDLVLPARHLGTREVQGLLRVLSSPWLLSQLASLPGYNPGRCGERITAP
jgi:molybdate-binding protein/DNA-binding XRE family transcriptional regulator